ncbi:hypothetical protein [Schlesneria paludicola]|uniref:hypothetical protein n=1 Tax=Schlesneria paludicola TaxID=360056 RepID=UPI00029AB754|nr:hypothetical protein [Schlesneria paludicola]
MLNRTRHFLLVAVVAIVLTYLFWWPLFAGAGLIGGDLYPYFFPQKAFYADCLKAGVFPLWNHLTGFGYPVLGESQTGAAFPLHLLFYSCFDLNTAYNIEHLLHYLICFVGTWLLAKRLQLTNVGAYLAAIVFTFGWFPARGCLEWAILTGAWMPVALWCVEAFLQTRLWRFAIGLSVALGLQLLAGHFHLAFITLLFIATYIPYRVWIRSDAVADLPATDDSARRRTFLVAALMLAVVAGGGLAAVQLLPSWELKQRSSRVATSTDYDPAYGHMPPVYASQLIAPWQWYNLLEVDEENVVRDLAEFVAPWHWFGPRQSPMNPQSLCTLDEAVQGSRFAALTAGTNKVEAHCYCGLIPVVMALIAIVEWLKTKRPGTRVNGAESLLQRTAGYWIVAGLFGLVYATGVLFPIGRLLPGFSFFRGPGRYGIMTTLAIALLAGQLLGQWSRRFSNGWMRIAVVSFLFASTCGDLWLVSRMVKYTVMVSPPRISFRESSEVRQRLLAEPSMPRMLAPGPNVGNLLGVSCVPWYLGIAPAEYVDPQNAIPPVPKPLGKNRPTPGSPELNEWLRRSGVTHVLNFEPLEESSWNVELMWRGVDPFLNRVWARDEPIFLYRFRPDPNGGPNGSLPTRASTITGTPRVDAPDWQQARINERRLTLGAELNESTRMVLTELAYPGWTARQGTAELAVMNQGLFRSVELLPGGSSEIQWSYRPWSVYLGAVISLATLLILAAIAHVRFWHPGLVNRWLKSA